MPQRRSAARQNVIATGSENDSAHRYAKRERKWALAATVSRLGAAATSFVGRADMQRLPVEVIDAMTSIGKPIRAGAA
jgi:hypothetical protein